MLYSFVMYRQASIIVKKIFTMSPLLPLSRLKIPFPFDGFLPGDWMARLVDEEEYLRKSTSSYMYIYMEKIYAVK